MALSPPPRPPPGRAVLITWPVGVLPWTLKQLLVPLMRTSWHEDHEGKLQVGSCLMPRKLQRVELEKKTTVWKCWIQDEWIWEYGKCQTMTENRHMDQNDISCRYFIQIYRTSFVAFVASNPRIWHPIDSNCAIGPSEDFKWLNHIETFERNDIITVVWLPEPAAIEAKGHLEEIWILKKSFWWRFFLRQTHDCF